MHAQVSKKEKNYLQFNQNKNYKRNEIYYYFYYSMKINKTKTTV